MAAEPNDIVAVGARAKLGAALDEVEAAGEQRGLWSATKDKRHAAYGSRLALARSEALDAVEEIAVEAACLGHEWVTLEGSPEERAAQWFDCEPPPAIQIARRLVRGKDGEHD
ncbi:MAG: hypothetical protein AMS18_00255 [Gemmatimonas sp. SG8_17]|nr:MAG: hypothetical protein AMS18_00255 [Gemmatimonas sp. SG8_17]